VNGTVYRGGKYDAQVLSKAITLLRQEGVVALGFRDGDADVHSFSPDLDAGAEFLELERPIGNRDLSQYLEGPLTAKRDLGRKTRLATRYL
jgi:hypothetical protein